MSITKQRRFVSKQGHPRSRYTTISYILYIDDCLLEVVKPVWHAVQSSSLCDTICGIAVDINSDMDIKLRTYIWRWSTRVYDLRVFHRTVLSVAFAGKAQSTPLTFNDQIRGKLR